ncbi:aminopeptidase P2 [Pseudoscourfieldia marina]
MLTTQYRTARSIRRPTITLRRPATCSHSRASAAAQKTLAVAPNTKFARTAAAAAAAPWAASNNTRHAFVAPCALLTNTTTMGKRGAAERSNTTAARSTASATQDATTRTPVDAGERLAALRAAMKREGVSAIIVPSEDAHASEYPPPCDEKRGYITGFTGSAGTAVVTSTDNESTALLWTDGRYFLQAEQQLDGDHWSLMRQGLPETPEVSAWLADNLPANAVVGVDPKLHSVGQMRGMVTALKQKHVNVTALEANLVDEVWGTDRPAAPDSQWRIHAATFAGKTTQEKLVDVRSKLRDIGATAVIAATLDEVAWLMNLRGADVAHCPVCVAYAFVDESRCLLYCDSAKVTDDVAAHLDEAGVEVRPYESIYDDVASYATEAVQHHMGERKICIDASKVSWWLEKAAKDAAIDVLKAPAKKKAKKGGDKKLPSSEENANRSEAELDAEAHHAILVEHPSPIIALKALKNDAELSGMQEAHLRDGAALARFFSWLEREVVKNGRTDIDETTIDEVLISEFRGKQEGFLEPSFPTIAGCNAHGAIIHYRATEQTALPVTRNDMLLLDSGAQFDCGTTDVTRTVYLGEEPDEVGEDGDAEARKLRAKFEHYRNCYTRVLQGHIALSDVVFPTGTPGFLLDTLARTPLWRRGLDYRHGTGHGVGAGLMVHEGPHGVSPKAYNTTPLEVGMIVSNEPGYYEDNAFGIRIENLVWIQEASTEYRFGGKDFLGFAPLTMVPLCRVLIDVDALSKEEIKWIDAYHETVRESVGSRLAGDDEALAWLNKNTEALLL